jgi:hypothetical protein
MALVLGITMLGTTLPTPLYVIYQGRWHLSLATASRLAPAERRGQAISAFFVACYAGLTIPVVGVGVLSEFTGTLPAVLTFSALLAVLCLFSMARIASPGEPA